MNTLIERLNKYFNPRSHERSDNFGIYEHKSEANFNPRSHERSDHQKEITHAVFEISIHAPTRGATQGTKASSTPASDISIHAPTRGATDGAALFGKEHKFQSTLPREERPIPYIESVTNITISIHAPTRGATTIRMADISRKLISIHAPTRGAT